MTTNDIETDIHRVYPFVIMQVFIKMKQAQLKSLKKAGIDITIEQWVVLFSLYEKDHLSQKELTENTLKGKSTITRMIDVLVKRSFVNKENSNSDARTTIISLTKAGKDLVKKALPIMHEGRTKGVNNIKEEELKACFKTLQKINLNLSN